MVEELKWVICNNCSTPLLLLSQLASYEVSSSACCGFSETSCTSVQCFSLSALSTATWLRVPSCSSSFSSMTLLAITSISWDNFFLGALFSKVTLEYSLVEEVFCFEDSPVYLPVGGSVVLQQGNRRTNHGLRASALRTTKKRKTKNPWRELKMTNIHWRTKAASRLVSTPTAVNSDRIHVSPSKVMIPKRERINLQASFGGNLRFFLSVLCLWRLRVCLMTTTATVTKIHKLKNMMRRIGPRNAPKKTPMWLMKQLQEGWEKYRVTEKGWWERQLYTHYPGVSLVMFSGAK